MACLVFSPTCLAFLGYVLVILFEFSSIKLVLIWYSNSPVKNTLASHNADHPVASSAHVPTAQRDPASPLVVVPGCV